MYYNEDLTIKACCDDPSVIFDLITEDYKDLVDKILTKKIVDINELDKEDNDVLTAMLKQGWYDLVLKYMKKKQWNVNHQNKDGDTFAHILMTKKYLDVMDIIEKLLKKDNFIPNIRNKKGETILDKSINNNYIYTTIKILEDERFNNIDLISFKNMYEKYIKSNSYGVYSKMNNLEIILDNLSYKDLLPKVEVLIDMIKSNIEKIKKEVFNHELKSLDIIIYGTLEESVA